MGFNYGCMTVQTGTGWGEIFFPLSQKNPGRAVVPALGETSARPIAADRS
jgi:hypothetical protein